MLPNLLFFEWDNEEERGTWERDGKGIRPLILAIDKKNTTFYLVSLLKGLWRYTAIIGGSTWTGSPWIWWYNLSQMAKKSPLFPQISIFPNLLATLITSPHPLHLLPLLLYKTLLHCLSCYFSTTRYTAIKILWTKHARVLCANCAWLIIFMSWKKPLELSFTDSLPHYWNVHA